MPTACSTDAEAGAQVNFITKSGTNGFHGDLNYNWNGDRMNANDFFANSEGLARTKAISNQWAADVGGPISKDKTVLLCGYGRSCIIRCRPRA